MTGVGQVPAPFLTACKIHDSICIVIRVWFAGDDWCRSGSHPFLLTVPKVYGCICAVIRVRFAGDDWCRSGSGPLLVLTSVMVGLTSDSLDIEVPSPSSWLLRI